MFIVGLCGNIDGAQQYMNIWAIQQDAAMDGENVSCLVATTFFEYANLNLRIADYHHLAAYFGGAIKQSYCIEFPIDETLGHFSATTARHYANCSNDHRFMDNQHMYTYKLAVEAWHHLLQLNGSPVDPPPSSTLTIKIPTGIDRPNGHCPLQSQCTSFLASLMYSITQSTPQPVVPPPLQDQTHKVRSL